MKVINYGSKYEIYPNDLKTFDQLPKGTYTVEFNPMSGFSLSKINNFVQKEPKIYGNHGVKVDKALKTFEIINRSLGIILSGDKGVGKSIFAQLLAERCTDNNLPVIIVKKAYPGIADYIESIDQEVLVLFDEFEKMFDSRKDGIEPQENLLGLLDGVSQKKKLFVITVNNLHRVNEFMINRQGRFHYHIRFGYLGHEEITEYLKDKLPSEYYGEIDNVVRFASRVPMNYDCLRAIAFELSLGLTFAEAIADLNILNTDGQRYDITLDLVNGDNGKSLSIINDKNETLDLFDESVTYGHYVDGIGYIRVNFSSSDIESNGGELIVRAENVELSETELVDAMDDLNIRVGDLRLKKSAQANYHYHAV